MAKNTGIAQFSQGRSDVHRCDPKLLVITEGWNSRDETPELAEHIDMLAQSIAEVGVKKPIEVKLEDGRLIVKDGHCRTRAAIRAIEHYKADLKTVPVISVDRYASDEELILNQIISNSGKPLSTVEQARVYKKLLDMGWNQSDIAKKVGMSNGRISQILGVLLLPKEILAGVTAGVISASLATSATASSKVNEGGSALIVEAIQTASDEGRKVKPADLAPVAPKMSIRDCFENSEIDNSDPDAGFVMIKMPVEEWDFVRKTFSL